MRRPAPLRHPPNSQAARLSICIGTNAAPERVAAVLAPLAGLDVGGPIEVILALDDRVGRKATGAYGAIADRIIRFPYRDPPERVHPLLFSSCRGRWVLRLDADEVPCDGLAGEITAVLADDLITHAWLPRLWLWGDVGTVLAQWPWRPDYQLRLYRNDPAVIRVPGAMHGYIEGEGARRYLRSPLLHADLLLNDRAARERRVARYAKVRPGLRIAGRELNHAYYLPEGVAELRTASLADADRAAVERLLAGAAGPSGRGAAEVLTATEAEVDALWDAAPWPQESYRAAIKLLDDDLRIHAGETRTFDVRVRNTGARRWPWGLGDYPGVRIAQRWHQEGADPVEGLRTGLPHNVAPGGSAVVPVQVAAPPQAGRWELEIDMVHEHVRWFGCGVRAPVDCV